MTAVKMPWAVVSFDTSNDCEAVPQKWLDDEDKDKIFCWWPPKCHKVSDLIAKESEIRHLPGAEKYEVRILGKNYDNVELARKKASKAQYESDLSSDPDRSKPRKRVAKALYSPPSSPPTPPNNRRNLHHRSFLGEKYTTPQLLQKSLPSPPQLSEFLESLAPPIQRAPDQNARAGCSTFNEITPVSKKKKTHCHDEEWKEKMSNDVAYIKLKLEDIYEVVTTLQTGSKNSDNLFEESEDNVESVVPRNPIIHEEELDNLERKLQDKKTYDFVVKEISRLGGTTTKEVTKRMLRKLFSDELAQHYSFHGFKKKVFGTLKIKNVIFDAVRKTPATVQSSDADIETVIKDWLRQAKFRLVAKKSKCSVAQVLEEQPPDQTINSEDATN